MTPLPTAFLSPGGGEFLLIMLALILLFGAKDAPRIFRSIHSTLDKLQRTAASFRYKIMFGDLHDDESPDSPPYDIAADLPKEEIKNQEAAVFADPGKKQETEPRPQESENGEQEAAAEQRLSPSDTRTRHSPPAPRP